MKSDADANKADDLKRKEEVETRNQGDQLVFQSKKQLEELKDKMSPESQGAINTAITDLENALKGTDSAAIKTSIDALNRVFSEASSKMYQDAAANQQGAGTPPPQDGASQNGHDGKVENAEYTVVDEEKK
jgi:molecular chaperone DnaK